MIGLGVRTARGPVEVLALPTPRGPMSGELLVQVIAAGIAAWDALLPTGGWGVGLQLPAALGVEAAGRVTAVGRDVRDFQIGDLVLVHDAPSREEAEPGPNTSSSMPPALRTAHRRSIRTSRRPCLSRP